MLGTGAMASLPALVRGLTTSSAAAAAVPAVASSSQGIASMFGFGSARVTTPLSEPLPAAPKPLKGSVPSVAPKLESSSLDAGTKVAAIDTPSPVSTVALVFESGSGFETDATEGASKVLEAMAFKATSNRTTFRLTRELEKIGATASAKAGRESVAFSVSALKMHAPEAVEMLVDSVVNARASYWEVAEAVEAAKAALTAAAKDPNAVLTDVLHRAAFDGALGKPQLVDPSTLDHFTNATLKEFLATLHPSKSVLAAAGVGLSDLKALANPLVDKSGASAPAKPSSTYVGGSLNVLATSPLTHVALAFEAKGGLSDAKAAAAAAVVKQLLDEGRAVLPRAHKEHDVFVSASSFAHLYQSTGLVGITAASAPAQGAALVDAVSKKVRMCLGRFVGFEA